MKIDIKKWHTDVAGDYYRLKYAHFRAKNLTIHDISPIVYFRDRGDSAESTQWRRVELSEAQQAAEVWIVDRGVDFPINYYVK